MKSYRNRLLLTLPPAIGIASGAALLAVALAQEPAPPPPGAAVEAKPQPPPAPECNVDLKRPGQMADVLSNLLVRAENQPEPEVEALLEGANKRFATGDDLLNAAAQRFKIDPKRLAELAEQWRHINCRHAVPPGYVTPDALRDGAVPAEAEPQPAAEPQCGIDLKLSGQMADVLSNLLIRAENQPEPEVEAFLEGANRRYATGGDLLNATAERFKIDPKRLEELVEQWRHINCQHAVPPGHVTPDQLRNGAGAAEEEDRNSNDSPPLPVSTFAADVTLHVVLHELGHAVIREFDVMVLGNEETMADAFATHLLTEHFPERALPAISARVRSLMIEAGEEPRDQWPVRGEHDNDARRAYQIAALAVAADREKYAGVAEIVGMSEKDIRSARDYGADIHRAWRRTLAPLMMPAGKTSKEARLRADDSTRAFVDAGTPSLASVIESALRSIDWHSQVTVDFVNSSGGAAWSRSKRTITVNSEYLRRFIAQGEKAATLEPSGNPSPVK